MLHVGERFAQLSDFVGAPVFRKRHAEVARRDGLRLAGEFRERLDLMADEPAAHQHQQQQSPDHGTRHRPAQLVETSEDVALGTDDGHAPAGGAERFVEDIAILAVDLQLAHALFTALHGVPQAHQGRVRMLHRFGENGLIHQLCRVGVHEIGTALTDHDAVGVRVRLHGRDGVGEP